jgi:cytochrome P450
MQTEIPFKADPQPAVIPGPSGFPWVGVMPKVWQQRPLHFFLDSALRYGNVVRLEMGPQPLFLITHPDDVQRVLQDNNRNYSKGYETVAPVIGNGLVTSEGATWLRQRRLMQPAFHRSRIAAMADTMTRLTAATLERWERTASRNEPIDVAQEMMRLTQAIIVETMFGQHIPADPDKVGRAFDDALAFMNQYMLLPIEQLQRFPTPTNIRFRRAIRFLDGLVYNMVEERRRSSEERDDLLSMLVHARDEETGEGMSEQQMRDEIMTIYLAGHETTANALSWTWFYLSNHPDLRRRLEAEVADTLEDHAPTAEDTRRLPYARMLFDETLRLMPPAWMFARRPNEPDELGGYTIPAGATVMLSPYVTHHRPDIWENPEGFDPERFAPGADAERAKYAYFPFGGGPRLCIGNNFAFMEAQLIMAMVTQRFRLDLVPGQRIQPKAVATLQAPRILMTVDGC